MDLAARRFRIFILQKAKCFALFTAFLAPTGRNHLAQGTAPGKVQATRKILLALKGRNTIVGKFPRIKKNQSHLGNTRPAAGVQNPKRTMKHRKIRLRGIVMLKSLVKRLPVVICLGLLLGTVPQTRAALPAPKSPPYRLALVLGGGAALGYAHLGVLKVLEENGIRPDLIVGTSMGAIVGGLYAGGNSPEKIISEAKHLSIFKLLHFKLMGLGFFDWTKTEAYLRSDLDHKTFADLQIPFAAIATDLVTGEEVVLDSGDVVKAVLASASVPGIYTPVKIGNHLLVDGGLVEDLPVRAAKRLGALHVIAVDVHHPLIKESIRTPFDAIRQALYILHQNHAENAKKLADIVIRPDLRKLSYTKFGAVQEGVEVGAAAAREQLPEIKALLLEVHRSAPVHHERN